MDQESFRQMLQTPSAGSSSTRTSRGSLLPTASKAKVVGASQPAFKPRKVKKSSDSKYRDRAAERRVGEGNDYAQVEAILEDFEKRATGTDKLAVEEQRQYLGGDSDHTILVKGLDMALVEQNKAKGALSIEDDDSLEQAFLEATSEPKAQPKKRTREEIIRELKEKRQQGAVSNVKEAKSAEDEALSLEKAKKEGKFKPIGFKPIAAAASKKKVKVDGKDSERKKKKRKAETNSASEPNGSKETESAPKPGEGSSSKPYVPPPEPEPEPVDADFDIFADAGDYKGFESGEEGEEEEKPSKDGRDDLEEEEGPSPNVPRRWIPTDNIDLDIKSTIRQQPERPPTPSKEDEEEEEEQPMRLVPLTSSVIPSIKDLLAMDDAAGSSDKKRKRKEKKKGGNDEESKKLTAEAKADRDYKRLKTYTEKKAGSSTTAT